ncbi:MAG: NAD(P)-dependent dehydrogenase (short-subunit alcohol dehydrogenase family) [Rhodothermales bacterium]|jgi:NAD(P)-dependent dehydrogenase (short-subunit alcohol dehydrogenase family)/rhamnose utilization protein RhaD (predicted bifunctional aldolase and dehydrogenase)
MNELEIIAEATRRYGSDTQHVFGGGGNTSWKDENYLYIKPSGVELGTLQAEQLVKIDRSLVEAAFGKSAPDDSHEREAWIKGELADAVCPGSTGRPSVETPVHHLLPGAYVIHTHAILFNGLSCAIAGKETCAELFPDVLWIAYTDPGYTLAVAIKEGIALYEAEHGHPPAVVVQQNHGIFVSGDSIADVDSHYDRILSKLSEIYDAKGLTLELATGGWDAEAMGTHAPQLRTLLANDGKRAVIVGHDDFAPVDGPLTPDHIVYAKSYGYVGEPTAEGLADFRSKHGYLPIVVQVPGAGLLACEKNLKSARLARDAAVNAAQVEQLTHAFGGPRYLSDSDREFIENWEVEIYRKKVAEGAAGSKPLTGRIALVTGAAQGFGKGIAEGLAAAGATIIVADFNAEGAAATAAELNANFGVGSADSLVVNIADEASMADGAASVVRNFGGLDLFVANAGVLRAGATDTFSLSDWEFVTKVNYTGYFLSVKHFSPLMSQQWVDGSCGWCDIVQINSKSGLQGSKRNAVYAGSKFGTIGLTQSFALELVEDHIKVNSVCPGNFFEGPLWSDPDRGLFVQYLNAGKVKGAKTIDDVRRFYEEKVPMGRGCRPVDVVRAILYAVAQEYETGQAIPVTGGQVMR